MTKAVQVTASALIIRSQPFASPQTDTGRRMTLGQTAVSHGQTWDGKWQFVVAHTGTGWVSAQYLQPAAPAPTPRPNRYTLDGEDPELTAAIDGLQMLAGAEGIEFTTADFGGVRTQADTTRILKYRDDDYAVYVRNLKARNPSARPTKKEIWRRIAPFGSSYHNYGAARDLKPTKWPPSFTESKALQRLRDLTGMVGLKVISNDPPHAQLNISLSEARKRWHRRTTA